LEALKVDRADAVSLEARIDEEKQNLNFLVNDLEEQKSLLEFHQTLQTEVVRQNYQSRMKQLEKFRVLKESETTIEQLIHQLQSRLEMEKVQETNRVSGFGGAAMVLGDFTKKRGTLGLPVAGRILSGYGRNWDPESGIHVFKKGLDIEVSKSDSVRAIAPGRIAFAGNLSQFGLVTIVDHGSQFYSLCAQMGALSRKQGEMIREGDVLGQVDPQGKPLYFEIRSKNVAVNPEPWLAKATVARSGTPE
jgi:septal ring factor EnvC (AmiA/AmiB activator)